MIDLMRDLNGEAMAQADKLRDLTVDELDAVSGGCVCGGPYCTSPCPCQGEKPSPIVK